MTAFWQNWAIITLLGASLNAINNYGYKVAAVDGGIIWIVAAVMVIAAFGSLVAARLFRHQSFSNVFSGRMPAIIIVFGIGLAVIFVCFLSALSSGPISLVDPMWACIYTLTSLAIGTVLIRERPSLVAMCGIALYLFGAVLMGLGAR
jgi:uncharacterized membrane protein